MVKGFFSYLCFQRRFFCTKVLLVVFVTWKADLWNTRHPLFPPLVLETTPFFSIYSWSLFTLAGSNLLALSLFRSSFRCFLTIFPNFVVVRGLLCFLSKNGRFSWGQFCAPTLRWPPFFYRFIKNSPRPLLVVSFFSTKGKPRAKVRSLSPSLFKFCNSVF